MRWWIRLPVALVMGAAAVPLVVLRLDGGDERAYGGAGDRVRAAAEGLRDDHVHVTEDGRHLLDEAGEAAVAAAIAERDLPVHVVVWRESRAAGYDHYIQAAEQVLHLLDEPGVLVLWQGPESSTTQASAGYSVVGEWAEEGDDGWGREVLDEPEYLGEAALRLPEWIDQLPDEPLERQSFDFYGGTFGGFMAGVLYAAPVLLGVWAVLALLTHLRRRRGPRAAKG